MSYIGIGDAVMTTTLVKQGENGCKNPKGCVQVKTVGKLSEAQQAAARAARENPNVVRQVEHAGGVSTVVFDRSPEALAKQAAEQQAAAGGGGSSLWWWLGAGAVVIAAVALTGKSKGSAKVSASR